jgi:hypothetical protein
MLVVTRTLVKRKGPGRTTTPTEVTGRAEPFPTTMEEGREGWGGGGRQDTCVRGGVVGGTGVSYLVRDRGGWGQLHRGKGAGERLRPTHWSRTPTQAEPEAPGVGGAPAEPERSRGCSRRGSDKEDRLGGGGVRGRSTRGWPGPHVDGTSPRVVEGGPLRGTWRAAPAARRAVVTTLAAAAATPSEPVGWRGAPEGGGAEVR